MDTATIINIALCVFVVGGLLFARYVERLNRESAKQVIKHHKP